MSHLYFYSADGRKATEALWDSEALRQNNPQCLIIKPFETSHELGGGRGGFWWGARQNELLTTVCAEDFRKLLKMSLEFEEAGNASAGGKSIGSLRDEAAFYPTSLFFPSFSDRKLQKQDTQGVFTEGTAGRLHFSSTFQTQRQNALRQKNN